MKGLGKILRSRAKYCTHAMSFRWYMPVNYRKCGSALFNRYCNGIPHVELSATLLSCKHIPPPAHHAWY